MLHNASDNIGTHVQYTKVTMFNNIIYLLYMDETIYNLVWSKGYIFLRIIVILFWI